MDVLAGVIVVAAAEGGGGGPSLLRFLARLHPAVVHFPIALLAVAALFELWQLARKRPGLAPGSGACVALGALAAVFASLFGWFLEEFDDTTGDLVSTHKWIGIACTVVALAAGGLSWKARTSGAALKAFRALILGAAGLASAAGYVGGQLVFGEDYHWEPLRAKPPKKEPPAPDPKPLQMPANPTPAVDDKVDFVKHVAPILEAHCLKCHGKEKTKGKLDLLTKAGFLKGGVSGRVVVPGNAEKSAFYSLLVDEDPETRMPPEKEKQMNKDQIAMVRKWIDQGADWPDGFEFKK
jgi:uncharacterized membrane protein